MKRSLAFCIALLILLCTACAPKKFAFAPESSPTASPAATVTAVPAPTETPVPADYDTVVDFGDQPALVSAVQYSLDTVTDGITYRMLDTVETLILSDASEITDLRPLARAGNLKTLVIVDGRMDLSVLSELPELSALTLTGGHFDDLGKVAVLPQLQELNLFGYDTADFSPLTEMSHLTTLRIGNHAPCDFSALSKMTQLTTLMIPDMRGNDLNWLGSLENLSDLTIWQCKQRYFDFLPKLTKLTHLNLDMRTDCDLTPIGTLKNLTSLSVDMESGRAMDDQSWLPGLTNLQTLRLNGLYFGNLSRLDGLTGLTSLTLGSTHDSVRLYELPELPNLTSLRIENCSVISAIELTRYPNLTSLALYNSPVDDPASISQLTGLQSLTLRIDDNGGERKLGNVERISALKRLIYLDWGGLGGDLTALSGLPALKRLRLCNARITDWTPITELSQLEALDLSGNQIKRVPDSIANMTNLTSLNLSSCKNLHYIAPLSAVPSLRRIILADKGLRDLETLCNMPALTGLMFVAGGSTVSSTGLPTVKTSAEPELMAVPLESLPAINGPESFSVLLRFTLDDFMHKPYYCCADWYPPYAVFE